MALKATIFKADVQIADIGRGYYADHALTLARHPSETDERMMLRLLAFCLHADAALAFCKGLSDADEPDLWRKDLTGAIELWVELGQPDERRIAQACGRARRVAIYSYGGKLAQPWWQQIGARLERHANLEVWCVDAETGRALAALAQRKMTLQVSIQDGHAWLTDGERSVVIEPRALKRAGA